MDKLNVKAVFFDFDDTLQSRKAAYRLYCERFLDRYFPRDDREERKNKLYEMEALVDGGYKDREVYFPELIRLWKWKNHPPLQELCDSFNNEYGKRVVMLNGAVETVKELKRRGYILGMITNGVSTLQNMKLDTAGIRGLFDVCVVSGDIGIYKPEPGIFEEALRLAGVDAGEAVYIGDHPVNDVEGALGAGMNVIRMNYGDFRGKGLDKEGVFATVETVPAVLEMLPPLSSAAKSKKAVPSKPKNANRSRSSAAAVKIISVICAFIMAALALVGHYTDVFNEKSGDKTILFSSMKADQKASFTSFINNYSALFEDGYDNEQTNFSSILRRLDPTNESGLFQSYFGKPEVISDGSDPAGRFAPGRNVTGYVSVSKADAQKLAAGLGQALRTDENSRDCYYWNDNFYLAVSSSSSAEPKLYAVLENSAQTTSGDYYCVCGIYSDAGALEDASAYTQLYKRYFIVSENQAGSETSWTLKKVLLDPAYSGSGSRIEDEGEKNSLDYSFKRKTFNATASDGTLFAVYYIEYPVFAQDGIAQAACESVYSDKMSEFRTKVANADSFYQAYVDAGGSLDALPLTTDVVVEVTYNSDGYISLVDRTSVYDPTPLKAPQNDEKTESETQEETSETTQEQIANSAPAVVLPVVQYEGYTFEVESGTFLKKDYLTGGNLASFSSKLAQLYTAAYIGETAGYGLEGYGYYGNAPVADGIGTEIYNSSWALNSEGMSFYYIPDDGLLSLVTVPWSELPVSIGSGASEG